jgi:hypothetical protein
MMVKAARRSTAKTSAQLLEEMLAEIDRLGPACVPGTVNWGPPDDHQTLGASIRPRKKSST